MKKILLVDDDLITNIVNKKQIEMMGVTCEISVAHHGKQALEMIQENYRVARQLPDIILLDINMPVMDGFQFLARLRELEFFDTHATKIAIISSSDNIEDKVKARDLGVTHYLVKPTTSNALRLVLE